MVENNQDLERLSDEDLAQRCVLRPVDQPAWEEFYSRFHGFVRSQVRNWSRWSSTETEDIVQEIFVRIFRILPTYDSSRARLRTYLSSKVIPRLVIDYWRPGTKLRSNTVSLDEEVTTLQLRAVQDPEILHAASERIVSRLGDKSKIELVRDLLDGKDVSDICTDRGVTKYQVYTARKWLVSEIREINSGLPDY